MVLSAQRSLEVSAANDGFEPLADGCCDLDECPMNTVIQSLTHRYRTSPVLEGDDEGMVSVGFWMLCGENCHASIA